MRRVLDHAVNLQGTTFRDYIDIEGREVSFGTKDEEFNGRHSVRVVWIGKQSDPNLSLSAARFFGAPHIDADNPGEELAF